MQEVEVQQSSTQPLVSPEVLCAAGVELDDALWFTQLKGADWFRALRTTRGKSILDAVRNHFAARNGIPEPNAVSA